MGFERARRGSCVTHWLTLVVRYFSVYELIAPMTAIAATAAIAKFKMASLSLPNAEVTNPCSHPGNLFDCRMLSIPILIGHGSRTSLNVSPNTATDSRLRAFQCGRMRRAMLNFPRWVG